MGNVASQDEPETGGKLYPFRKKQSGMECADRMPRKGTRRFERRTLLKAGLQLAIAGQCGVMGLRDEGRDGAFVLL